MSNITTPKIKNISLTEAYELVQNYRVPADYGWVQIQKNRAANSISNGGIYIRNCSSANLARYTISWVDLDGNLTTSGRITKARIQAIKAIITGKVEVPVDILENLKTGGYNGLRAYHEAKKGEVDESRLEKIRKTAISHFELPEDIYRGEAGHLARMAIR